jgi:choline dehydrogenase-like flavoprotein
VDLLGPILKIDLFKPAEPNEAHSTTKLSRADFGVMAYEVGTMRMGTSASSKSPYVVNENLKVDGWKNLFVCDLSVFPISPTANPSLILAALA